MILNLTDSSAVTSMKTRTSIIAGTSLVFSLLLSIGACMPTDPGGDSPLANGKGSGGSGSGSGGSVTCGTSSSGSGGFDGTAQPATFDTVFMVTDFYCGGSDCHNNGDRNPNLKGLADNQTLFNTLMNFKADLCCNLPMVKPGKPQESAFYLAQAGMCDGLDKMPKGCVDNCTAPDYLEGIRQWIANGAPGP